MAEGTGSKKAEEKKPEQKNVRLDRMEENIQLLEDGLLVLINLVLWNNNTITPIGTHNPSAETEELLSLEDAVDRFLPDDPDGN